MDCFWRHLLLSLTRIPLGWNGERVLIIDTSLALAVNDNTNGRKGTICTNPTLSRLLRKNKFPLQLLQDVQPVNSAS